MQIDACASQNYEQLLRNSLCRYDTRNIFEIQHRRKSTDNYRAPKAGNSIMPVDVWKKREKEKG